MPTLYITDGNINAVPPVPMIVMHIFNKARGVAYDPPAGQFMLDVPSGTSVGTGFVATFADGEWTFAERVAADGPVTPQTEAEIIAAMEVKVAEMAMQIDALKANRG